jgi:branched-chain amino acid transport system ATP-binding protein
MRAGTRRTTVLEVRDLSAGYGPVQILWDIALEVNENEIVALVGANGAGKSTLLGTISGLIPGEGKIMWDGKNICGLAPERIVPLGIAHVPEGRHLFAGLTVRENLAIGAYHRKERVSKRDLERVIGYFPRLGERLKQVAGQLSGGEQQMCAIARGLMARPRLLMIDELSLGLAPNLVDDLLDRLVEIQSEGTAILLVEQDVDAALHVASRGYVLETGRVVAGGPSEELLEDQRVRQAYLGVA